MGQTIESVKILNSVVRTGLVVVGLGGLGWAGWTGYSIYYEQELLTRKQAEQLKEAEKSIVQLTETVESQTREIERLDTAMRLLKIDHRVARLDVVDQRTDGAGKLMTVVEFVELNDEGRPVDGPRQFEIEGDVIYLDNWIVKFDDKYVETADIDRSTSLVLFRRLFGEHQEPKDGFPLDRGQGPPRAYTRGGVVSEFEKKIWSEFWTIANDDAKAKEMGIRAAHGQAVSIKAQKGKSYRILLRASDGLSIVPDGEIAPRKTT
jgi:hypothetical protein